MGFQRILSTDCTDRKFQSDVVYGLLIHFV